VLSCTVDDDDIAVDDDDCAVDDDDCAVDDDDFSSSSLTPDDDDDDLTFLFSSLLPGIGRFRGLYENTHAYALPS